MGQGKKQPNLKEIRSLGSEIIAIRTDDGRTDVGRTADRVRFHEHEHSHSHEHSQAELKIGRCIRRSKKR